jgi:hypothetical protein
MPTQTGAPTIEHDKQALLVHNKYYTDLGAKQKPGIDKIAAHHLRRAELIAEHGVARGNALAVAELREPATVAQDAMAQQYYGVPYKALCCERKRAVDAALASAELEAKNG